MCLVLMLSFAACKNKDGGSDTTAPAENTAEDTTSSLEDIINALNGVDTTDSSNPASTTEATEPETMPKGHEIKDNGAKKDIKKTRFYTYFQKNSKRDSYTMTATCSSNMQGASVNVPLTMVKSGKKSLYEHESSCRQRRINDNVVHFGRRQVLYGIPRGQDVSRR